MTTTANGTTELADLLREVRRIEMQVRRLVKGTMAGGYASVFRGAGLEFEGVREYAEGDDPRRVDWNVTARVGRPYVKTFVPERDRTVLFLLDLSPSMAGGFGAWSTRQAAARACACLALSAARSGDRVGLVAFGDRVERFVRPARGLPHALRVIRDVLALPAAGTSTDLVPALRLAEQVVRRHAVLFLVSDFLAGGWSHDLARCARRHDLVAMRFLVPELASLPRGLLRVVDPEGAGGRTVVDGSSRKVRAAWAGRVAAWRARTEEDLRRARVDRIDVEVPVRPDLDAVVRPILRFIRMREGREAKR